MSLKCYVLFILLWMHFSLHLILEASLENPFVRLTPSMMHVAVFWEISSAMDSKHSELTKRQTRDRYRRFASPSSRTAPPQKLQTPPHSSSSLALGGDFVGWLSGDVGGPPQCSSSSSTHVTPPPPACLVAPPSLTHMEEVSSDDSPSDSSGYNEECPHVIEVSSYTWTASRFQLFRRITKCVHAHF
jgi:hypothetical protein